MRLILALLCGVMSLCWGAPQRIVSTAPSVTETLFALGLGDRVVGVTNYCHYPPEAKTRTRVGSFLKPDVETILALRADLVIVQKNPTNLVGRLRGLKQNVLEVDYNDVAGIMRMIETIGAAAGAPERGKKLAQSVRQQLDDLRQKTAATPRRSLMFIVGRTPGTLEGLVAVGRGSFLSELMDAAGGVNVFRDAVAMYPKVNLEEVLARNPDVIVDMGHMAETVGISDEQKKSIVTLWGRQPLLKAVQQQRVYAVASDIFVVPGPRIVDAALAFARMLHPEARF